MDERNDFIAGGLDWLAQNDMIFTPALIDGIILNCLMMSKKIKNVTLDIDEKNMSITINLYLSRWSMIFLNKNKIKDMVKSIIFDRLPQCIINVNFRVHYDKKKDK